MAAFPDKEIPEELLFQYFRDQYSFFTFLKTV